MGSIFNSTGKEADRVPISQIDQFEKEFFDNVPLVLSPEARRKAVFGAVRLWAQMFPEEVESAKRQAAEVYKATGGEVPRTREGEQFIGMLPQKVDTILVQAFNDPNYLWNNPKVLEDLSDAFRIGFFGKKASLNSADRAERKTYA